MESTGGDIVNNDGSGVFSIYGSNGAFEDENFVVKHTGPGSECDWEQVRRP